MAWTGGGFNTGGYGTGDGYGLGSSTGGSGLNSSGYGTEGGYGLGNAGWGGSGFNTTGYGGGSGYGLGSSYNADGWWTPASQLPAAQTDYGLGSMWGGSTAPSAPSFSSFSMAPADYSFSAPSTAPAGPPAWSGMTNISMPGAAGTMAPSSETPGFMDSDFVKGLRKAGLYAARTNPQAAQAMNVLGAGEALGAGNYGQAAGTALGMATGNNALGGLFGIGVDAMTNPTRTYAEAGATGPTQVTVDSRGMPARTTGQRLAGMGMQAVGGMLGGAIGGPFGSMIGADAMGRLAQNGATGPTPGTNAGMGQQAGAALPPQQTKEGGDWLGPLAGGLMGLYGLNQMRGTNKEQQAAMDAQTAQIQALQQQIQAPQTAIAAPRAPHVRQPNFAAIQNQLAGMFGPQSSYAAEMRSQLERKDAAAGRRSQYGPREANLMAELVRARAQAEPAYMNAEVGAANASNQAAMGIYGSQMNGYNSQLQDRQQNLQRLLAAQQLGMTNTNNQFTNQQAADTRRQQQLATLYGMGKETGFFDWAGDKIGGYF